MQQGDRGVRLEPLLEAISEFLDDQRDVIECIRRDLVRGLKQPGGGRNGLTPTQVLRSLVLMRLKNWDYRELRERIADGLTLRQFTDFYCAPVPKHDAFQRSFIRLTPQTLKAVNDLVVRAAVELGLEDGAKLRVDTRWCRPTFIIRPTNVAMGCGPRRHALGRPSGQSAGTTQIKGFRDRTRSARRRMYEIQRMTTRQRHEQQTHTYRVLIDIAEEVVETHERGSRGPAGCAARTCSPTWPSRSCAADRALLRAGRSCDRSGTSSRALRRAGPY